MLSYYGGASLVLASVQARRLHADSSADQMVLDVVREMALAARMPVPKAYLMNDPSPNAFATGRDPQHSVICVTQGLVDTMDREELQGVLGHEMAHVRDYDIRTMMMIAVLVAGIAMLADFVYRSMWFRAASAAVVRQAAAAATTTIAAATRARLLASWWSCSRCWRRFSHNCSRWQCRASANIWPTPLRSNSRAIREPCCARSNVSPKPNRRCATPRAAPRTCSSSIRWRARVHDDEGFFANLFSTHPPLGRRIERLRALLNEAGGEAPPAAAATTAPRG